MVARVIVAFNHNGTPNAAGRGTLGNSGTGALVVEIDATAIGTINNLRTAFAEAFKELSANAGLK